MATPHFDAAALCIETLKQTIGLAVTTSDKATFRRRMYEHMARHPEHKVRILTGHADNVFYLVKPSAVAQPA